MAKFRPANTWRRVLLVVGVVVATVLVVLRFGTGGVGHGLAPAGTPAPPPAQPAVGGTLAPRTDTVVRVVDGDTVETVGHPETVRLLLVDTDETRNNSHGQRTCWGPEAERRLVGLLGLDEPGVAAAVTLVMDAETRDNHGRWLAYIVLPDGTDVGWWLVRNGLGDVDVYPPNGARVGSYRAAEAAAQADKRGVWSGRCPDGTPYQRPADTR